ncbi:glycosyltransferase family 2 protein [Desulfonatronum thiodismutans]|uniref:glycosyltransferase family 2 protein n=1 Tax=Desulfonatronum thiodismutans TaxID=159290 RepID=UPI0013785750|nr:glycosyltransferase family 2 protein [Desulfonatronum thiodismutans]
MSFFLIIYCYFAYPVLLWVFTRVYARPVIKSPLRAGVSVVIAAWNEQDVIERKLNNLFSLEYPSEDCEILIGSDGSTDQTNAMIERFAASPENMDSGQGRNPVIRFFPFQERRGKMAVLNELVGAARNDILVFTDARQVFEPDAVRQLVDNFSDPAVGCVSGELVFRTKDGATARGINLYWNYEKFMRRLESAIHSMLGATGAIYAIRRNLFTPLPASAVLDDMITPLRIIARGYRAVFDGTARAYDEVADNPREESRRKGRTLYGNYQIFWMMPQVFNPFTSPIALQMFSHKLLRVLAPLLLIAVFVSNILLAGAPFYAVLLILQGIFYALALLGALTRSQTSGWGKALSRIAYIPYVFCLLNFSALGGLAKFLSSGQSVLWDKARD